MLRRRPFVQCLLIATASATGLLSTASVASDYPTRPIKLIVPFAPGGITDLIARQMAKGMSEKLGQQVVIDNKPGAGHVPSLQGLAQAQPDGYTILLGSNTGFTVAPHMYKDLGFDVRKFKPIAPINTAPTVLVARPDFPANNLTDLVKIAKEKPDSLTYGSFGMGTSAHLGMEIFKKDLGIELTHVPYKGDAPAYMALKSKEVDVAFITMFSAQDRIRSGELKALGTLQSNRIAEHPSIQTTAEAGSKNADLPVWIAFFAPPETPDSIMKTLENATRSTVASAEFQEFLKSRGAEPFTIDNPTLLAFIQAQSEKIEPLVKSLGLR